jgi:hypothetical protein
MIINGAILFLKVFDLVCDTYEWITKRIAKVGRRVTVSSREEKRQSSYILQ